MIEPIDDDRWRHGPLRDDDLEEDDETYSEDEDGDSLSECSNCGAGIFDDAEQCPYCGEWITRDRHPMLNKPVWFVLLGVVGVMLALIVLMLRG